MKKYLYIPLLGSSIFLIWLSLPSLSFENEASLEFSFEIEHIDERKLDEKFVDRDIINSLLSSNLPSSDKNSFLLLFISEANSCGNCLNEVNDYIEISKKINSKLDFYTALIYHSEDSLQAKRFSNASNFEKEVDYLTITNSSNIMEMKLAYLLPRYYVKNSLYLIDLKNNILFHGFILPSGKTTKLDVKEIAFSNAIKTYTSK
ncbi:MAG: hypothetical protein ABJR05_13660 [Balneola sp.]